MKTFPFLLFLCLSPLLAFAQTEKGVTPLNPHSVPSTRDTPHSTRAVVVGISDYQSPAIPNLQYADRDAKAFAAWLESPAGGSVPEENILLLTDSNATMGALAGALDGLQEECGENDLAIIYFSGHGDVESKTAGQLGFLLPWDTPQRCYKAGAYSLVYLQDVINTLCTIKKAQVLVIADACHSGKLAGSSIGGAQTTAANLAMKFASELKILSCRADEFSLEGTQWGGGRGVFSWHLIDGLSGLADQNGDGTITLMEIQGYLQANVPKETYPEPQTPFTIGDLRAPVALVHAATADTLRRRKEQERQKMMVLNTKSREDIVLSGADSSAQQLYKQFRDALEHGQLLNPAGASANDYYLQLLDYPDIAPLYNLMRRNLAAALQDEVQQALNALLESDPYEVNYWRVEPEKYQQYPAYLQRAIELLGDNHYLHNNLLAKKIFFETYLQTRNLTDRENDPVKREAIRQSAIQALRIAIDLDPTASYLYYGLGSQYAFNIPYRTDSMRVWMEKALDISPEWLLPMLDISYE